MATSDRLASDTRVGRVALTVRSLAEVLPFYREVIGLALHDDAGGRASLGAPDEVLLELVEAPNAPRRTRAEAGLYHVALRVPTRAALGAALERIEADWHLDGATDHGVSEALYCRDPADNGLEIYRDRPREEWPTDEAGRVDMRTAPLALDELRAASNDGATIPVGTDVGHVHLEVTDLAAARAFYVDALGMNVRTRYGDDALFVAAGDYHHHVGLNTWNGHTAAATVDSCGLTWYELVVPDAGELRRLVDRVLDAGVDVAGDAGELTVRDPDGVTVRLRPAVGVADGDRVERRE